MAPISEENAVVDTEEIQTEFQSEFQTMTDVDRVYEIGGHIAAGRPPDETLAAIVNFVTVLVNCDLCLIYIRKGAELVPWVGRNPDHEAVGHIRLTPGQDCVAYLAKHRVPI